MSKKFDSTLIPPEPDFAFEIMIWESGINWVAGVDEAGRGALAGPVAAAAVVLPIDESLTRELRGVRDSKQMTAKEREFWSNRLPEHALTYGVGFASSVEIDDVGIVSATRLAMSRAINQLSIVPEHLLIDYMEIPDCDIPQTPLIKGDARSLSIAAASILAKTARDRCMCDFDAVYPEYGFASNKGYGTVMHKDVLAHKGYCPIHRKTFKGVFNL